MALTWTLTLAAVSASGQSTVVSNASLAAFSSGVAAGGTVTFAFDGTITLTNSLTVTNSVTVDGTGHSITLSGGSNNQVFAVATNSTLFLKTLTLANGLSTTPSASCCVPGDYHEGGAITNGGLLIIDNCVFSNNTSQQPVYFVSGQGGALFNEGSLLISNSTFIQNKAVGDVGNGAVPGTGGSASGGAIYNAGNAVIVNCAFSGNRATGGDGGTVGDYGTEGGDGGQAFGGAIYNSGNIVLSNSTFLWNASAGGAGGDGDFSNHFYPAGVGGQGGDADGGAICSFSGGATVVNSTFMSNAVAAGAGGKGGNGQYPQGTYAADPNGGNGGNGGNGVGGAICLSGGTLSLTNITCASNAASGALGGAGGMAYLTPGATNGISGTAGFTQGATAANLGGTLVVKNSILYAQRDGTNGFGPLIDAGNNLSSDQSSFLTNVTSHNAVNPMLGTLGHYGGYTETIPLLLGSPAINGGDPRAFPPTDQRGRHRPSGPAPDIGAFEYTFPTLSGLSIIEGTAQFVLSGELGDICLVEASSNLVDWTTIATNSIGAADATNVLDATVTPSGCRFYRARLR